MAPRLKVFRAQMGFHEAIVAAPSQKAALAAWGTRQDLFGEGLASVLDEPKAVKAAVASPGVVLSRPVGSKAGFEPAGQGSELPKVPKAKPKPKAPATKAPPRPKPPPDRSRLDAAEAALREAEDQQRQALADLARERNALDARELDLRRQHDKEARRLERDIEAARKAYEKADG